MPAYLIIKARVNDPDGMSAYRTGVMPLIARFNGRHIVRGATAETLEGASPNGRLNVIQFPSLEDLHGFWHSPEYTEMIELRRGAATFDAWAVDGIK